MESALRACGENPYWREPDAELVLSLWQDSGQSLSAFGRQFGISVQKLRRWRHRLRDRELLTLPPSVRIYLATESIDMRKGFDGLIAIVRNKWLKDPFSGHLFVFVSRRRDRAKVL